MPVPSLDTPVRKLEFVAFDTETTGLIAANERVVEVSGVRFSLDGEIGTFDELVNPGQPIPGAAARVHKITDAQVVDAPAIGHVLPRFIEFAEGAILLAHNAEFDVTFLNQEALRCGYKMPRVPVVDTVELSRLLRADLPNHKLETISKAFGFPAPTYHRALADSQTLQQCFEHLIAEGPVDGTLADLLRSSAGAMTFGADARLRMWLPPHLKALEEAFEGDGRVTILYEPEGKRQDTRDIRPRGYMRRQGATFLMAHCEGDRTDRSFRLDWITRAQYSQATLF